MTRASSWLIRASLVHLCAGATLGAWMLAAKAGGAPSTGPWVFPLHVELMLYGWTLQLVFGVAHWILPRLPGRERDEGVGFVWSAALALNIGIVCIAAAALAGPHRLALAGSLEAAGRVLEAAAATLFAAHAWRRVRPYGVTAASP